MASVGSIIDSVKTTLQAQDSSASRWDDNELLEYLNEGQAEIASGTRAFKREISLPATDSGVYRLPDDSVGIMWVMYDRKMIEPISYRELLQRVGDTFRDRTASVPENWYNDMSSPLELRLYPIPSTITRAIVSISGGDFGMPAYADHDETGVDILDQDGDEFATEGDRVGFIFRMDDDENLVEFDSFDDQFLPSTQKGGGFGVEQANSVAIDQNRPHWAVGAMADPAQSRSYGFTKVGFTEALRIGYAYIPPPYRDRRQEIVLPDNHEAALKWWMLHRCYEKSTSEEDLNRSDRYYQKFVARVNQTVGEESRRHTTRPRRARYRRN